MNCPRCNRQSKPVGCRRFWCQWCSMLHDDDPDEGGDYTSANPVRSAISREEYELRQRARRDSRRKRNRRGGR